MARRASRGMKSRSLEYVLIIERGSPTARRARGEGSQDRLNTFSSLRGGPPRPEGPEGKEVKIACGVDHCSRNDRSEGCVNIANIVNIVNIANM